MNSERAVALQVREGLARRRMSRQQLAVHAQVSLSTLEKGLAGERPFTLATIVRLESALDLSLREGPIETASGQAPLELGAYRREGVAWLIGTYLTLRPSFEQPDAIYAYLTRIAWDEAAGHLVFCEEERRDASFAQRGAVSMPYQSGQIYLVTNSQGQYRLATLSRPSITGSMYGLLSTLRSGRGGRLTPVATPIAFLRQNEDSPNKPPLGLVSEGQPSFAAYNSEIQRLREEEFGLLF